MYILIDLVVFLIISLCVYLSARQGFVKAFVEVAGFVLAVMITFAISTPLAEFTYDKLIAPRMIAAVDDAIDDESDNVGSAANDALPEFVADNAKKLGISLDDFKETVENNISKGSSSAAKIATDKVVRPVISKVFALVYAIIIMIALMIVVKLLARIINKIFSFSILGKLNRFLGGVIGVPKGIVFSILFCMTVSLAVSLFGGFLIFTNESIEKTFLFKFFAELI